MRNITLSLLGTITMLIKKIKHLEHFIVLYFNFFFNYQVLASELKLDLCSSQIKLVTISVRFS